MRSIDIAKSKLHIGTHVSGISLDVLKYEIDSRVSGKILYIQSGIHGGEVTYWVIHELFKFLREGLNRGKVIIVPFANPVAWMQRTYFYTHGKFDMYSGSDWNRDFPGSSAGGLGERIAAILFREACESDFALDLHTSRDSIPFAMFSEMDYLDYVKTLGFEYNYYHEHRKNPKYVGTLSAQLDIKGIPNLELECGGHDEYDSQKVKTVVEGLLRILRKLDMTDSSYDRSVASKQPNYFEKSKRYLATDGGIVQFHKFPGEKFHTGDKLYTSFNPENLEETTQDTHAAESGLVLKISPTHIHWPGDEVIQIVPLDLLKRIPVDGA